MEMINEKITDIPDRKEMYLKRPAPGMSNSFK